MSNFYDDLARGRQGEILVTKALREMGHTVEDVTKDSDYWKKDIDLIVDGGTLVSLYFNWLFSYHQSTRNWSGLSARPYRTTGGYSCAAKVHRRVHITAP